MSYWRMPERLYDDPDELARLGAAGRWLRRARGAYAGRQEDHTQPKTLRKAPRSKI